MTPVLDGQARKVLRALKPGDLFTLRDEKNVVVRCDLIVHPAELPPVVRGYEMEGPKGRRSERMYRCIAIARVDRILPEE